MQSYAHRLSYKPSNQPQPSLADRTGPLAERGKLMITIVIVLFTFTMSVIILMSKALMEMFPSINTINFYVGIVLTAVFIVSMFYYKRFPQWELALVGLWLLWSLTGFIVAYNLNHFVSEYLTALQVWVFGLIAFGVAAIREDLRGNIVSYVPALTFVIVYGMITGEFQSALAGDEVRVYSIATNPNTIGQQGIPYIGFLIYIFKETKNKTLRVVLVALMIIAAATIVFTGSRKGILGLGFAIALYYFFQFARRKNKRLGEFLLSTLFIVVIIALVPIILNETVAGNRLLEFLMNPMSEEKRINMYIDGWGMFLQHPFSGVGLGNYRLLSPYQGAAHSDYMEILTGTGLVGFALYFSMYFVGYFRIQRVRKLKLNSNDRHHANMLLALFLVEVALNFGRSVYISPYHSFVLMTYFGYAYGLERKYGRLRKLGRSQAQPIPGQLIS